jgi:AcrR family transcriptional regulator
MSNAIHETRTALLEAAERLLVASEDGDVSTRAICESVGVGQPVLYRLFGDKQGLLDALAESGLARYAARKAEMESTQDAVADLRAGWDDHMAFASENPAIYRLMFSPRPGVDNEARNGVLTLLKSALRRCGAAGVLNRDVDVSAAMLLSANVGLALNRIAQPSVYGAPEISSAVRDALFASILTGPVSTSPPPGTAAAARQLHAQIGIEPPGSLELEELALLRAWLRRLAQ